MMPTASFDAFFHGVPLPISPGQTKQLDYWFHRSPLLIPDVTATTYTYGLQMRARIVQPTTRTIQMRARIRADGLQTISLRGYIKTPQVIDLRARISRKQGWPILNAVDPGFPTFQPTQLNMRGRITQGTGARQSLFVRASIRKGGTGLLNARARVVLASYLSMRAKIQPRFRSSSAEMIFFVSSAQSASALMLFYTEGFSGLQSMSMRARIAPAYQSSFTGRFDVFQDPGTSKVIPIRFTHSEDSLQAVTMRARIAVP